MFCVLKFLKPYLLEGLILNENQKANWEASRKLYLSTVRRR